MSHPLLTGLSGYLAVHNAIRGDYPVLEAASSLLPICDEVLIADCDSDDGTLAMLTKFAATDCKVRVISVPWPKLPTYEQWKSDSPRPPNDNWFWPKLINEVRPHLRYQFQLHLDADEVLFPCAWPQIVECMESRGARWFRRINFWQDAHHCVPEGWVCGTQVARLGLTELWMPSDEPHPEGEPPMRILAKHHPNLVIGHYGFLRKQEGFFVKSKVMQTAVIGDYDKRLEEAERTGRNWWELSTFPAELCRYEGEHPECIKKWLEERNRL